MIRFSMDVLRRATVSYGVQLRRKKMVIMRHGGTVRNVEVEQVSVTLALLLSHEYHLDCVYFFLLPKSTVFR